MSNPINLPSCLLCQVPEGAFAFSAGYGFDSATLYFNIRNNGSKLHHIPIPPGNYGSPFLANEATGEQAYEYLPITTCIDYNLNPSTTVVIPKK